MDAWSPHNIAFGRHPAVLWIGTPAGSLVEVGLTDRRVVQHDVLAGSPVTALAATATATATGELVVAGGVGDLVLVSVLTGPTNGVATDNETSRAAAAAFLEATSEVPDDGDVETHLVITDGDRTWEPADLETVTTATGADPTWLQLQAAINKQR